MADTLSSEDLEDLLSGVFEPDTETIRMAEEGLASYLANPANVLNLLELVNGSESANIRHLSGLIIKQKLPNLWHDLEDDSKQSIKEGILHLLTTEPEKLVRVAICGFETNCVM